MGCGCLHANLDKLGRCDVGLSKIHARFAWEVGPPVDDHTTARLLKTVEEAAKAGVQVDVRSSSSMSSAVADAIGHLRGRR
jgi:hypothetical protein